MRCATSLFDGPGQASRRAIMWTLLLWLQLLAGCTAAPAFGAADARAVRQVVQGQLDAFANDDAARAFAYAAPGLRRAVGSADKFMVLVSQGYPVVYRPASVAFLKAEGRKDKAVQRVQMVDAGGRAWLAIYTLEHQPGSTWLISSCVVKASSAQMT